MQKENYNSFDYYTPKGTYAVRAYSRNGDGLFVAYVDTLKDAETIRTNHGLEIGLEPEPTYKDFCFYPTIWKWNTVKNHYERLTGY